MTGKHLTNQVSIRRREQVLNGNPMNSITICFPAKFMRNAGFLKGDILGYELQDNLLVFSIKLDAAKLCAREKLARLSVNFAISISPDRLPEIFREFAIPDKAIRVPFEIVGDTLVADLSGLKAKPILKPAIAREVKETRKVPSFAGFFR